MILRIDEQRLLERRLQMRKLIDREDHLIRAETARHPSFHATFCIGDFVDSARAGSSPEQNWTMNERRAIQCANLIRGIGR